MHKHIPNIQTDTYTAHAQPYTQTPISIPSHMCTSPLNQIHSQNCRHTHTQDTAHTYTAYIHREHIHTYTLYTHSIHSIYTHTRIFLWPTPILSMFAFPIPGRSFSWETEGHMSAGPGHCSREKDADMTGPASHPALTLGTEGCSVLGLLCHLQPPATLWAHVWSPLPATIPAVPACTVC